MSKRTHEPGHATGLRRLLGVGAAAAMAATVVAPASADPDENESLGTAADYGITAPESATVYSDGQISGTPSVPHGYFVQLQGRAVAEGNLPAAVAAEQVTFQSQAEQLGVDLDVRYTFSSLFNGLSINASDADVQRLAQASTVQAIFPIYEIDRPVTQQGSSVAPAMDHANGMTGVDEAHAMGFTGEGLKIGIIDSGVDVDHPDFGGGGTPTDGLHDDWRTDQIQFGIDLVGDDFNATAASALYNPIPQPDANPDDCGIGASAGHGTHVAGIAAGNGDPEAGGVVGVAPDATLGAYRVFGCNGSTTADIMLSALEQAYEDGMDVVNMSIGSALQSWKQYPTAVAADAAVDAGMVVVASIGNEGVLGLYAAGAPGVGEKVIGVASFDNVSVTLNAFSVSPDDTLVGWIDSEGAPTPPEEGSAPLSRLGDPGSEEAQGCDPDAVEIDLSGTGVLIQRGECTFHEKAVTGQENGADFVVLYNNEPGLLNPTVEGEVEITIPVVFITQEDGELIDARIVEGETTLTWTTELTEVPSPTAGLISTFSSYGLTAELDFKPDIGGPGGNIFSTLPLEQGAYGPNSGTSMSSPHVAGTVALLLQARPELDAEQVRDVLQNHADPAPWSLNPGLGALEGAFRQGAGLVDIDDAILSTTTISPGKLALGDGAEGHEVTVTISNSSDDAVEYAIGHLSDTVAAGGDSMLPGFFLAPAALDAPDTVAVGAQQSVDVTMTITPSTDENLLYSGWITFTAGDDDPLRVPYAGHAGTYQDLDVLIPGEVGIDLPVLAQLTDCDRLIGDDCAWNGGWDVFPETGAGDEPVYSLVDGDVPTVLAIFAQQARSLTMTAYEANDDGSIGAEVGEARHVDYLGRSADPEAFSAWTWNGTIDGERVADGKYIVQVDVLKPLGDPENDDHWESFTTPAFTIIGEDDSVTSPSVKRYEGQDRYAVAARIAADHDPGVETVYIASGQTFADALAGGAVAASEGAPLLLVRAGDIPGPTQFELDRLQPANIVVLGGPDTINGRVQNLLRTYLDSSADGSVTRVGGADRYAVAANLAAGSSSDTVYVANGQDFPDALAGGARAGALDAPVLLVQPGHLPNATRAALESLAPSSIVVLGGTDSVSKSVFTQLGEYGSAERIDGQHRYDIAAALSGDYEPGADVAFVATGATYADALAGGARAGDLEAPLLLVKKDSIPNVTVAELLRLEAREVIILGGPDSVSHDVRDLIEGLVYGD